MPIFNETATGGVLCGGISPNTAIFNPGISGGAKNSGNVEEKQGKRPSEGFHMPMESI